MLLRLLPWFLFRRGHVMLLLHHLRINLASPLVDHPIISTIAYPRRIASSRSEQSEGGGPSKVCPTFNMGRHAS